MSSVIRGDDNWNSTDAVLGHAKAWVNFNGTGTVAIRASHNVASITDNGTANYNVNFLNAMPDANYCVTVSGQTSTNATSRGTFIWVVGGMSSYTPSTTTVNVTGEDRLGAISADSYYVGVAVFR